MEPLRRHLGLTKQKARQRAAELLDLVGIPSPTDRLNDYPHQFSSGTRQRVMIAIISGCGQGLILPATTALVGRTATADNIGTVMGVYGALRNLGKIIGPIIIGGVLESGALDFLTLFQFLAVFLLIGAVVFAARGR